MTQYIPERTNTTGVMKVSIEKPDDSSGTIVSHDWCDPCTWYTQSVRVLGETPVQDSGNADKYDLNAKNIIDLKHSRLYGEDNLASTYEVIVKDGETVLEEDVNYTVDYKLGSINLINGYTIQTGLTATYSKANGSLYELIPTVGKVLMVEHSELNFSQDCKINSPIQFQVFAGGNPVKTIKYKNEKDLINAANLGQGSIPQFGNLLHPVIVFPFNYVTVTPLKSSLAMKIQLKLLNDIDSNGDMIPLTGSFGTASFYIISVKDPDYPTG